MFVLCVCFCLFELESVRIKNKVCLQSLIAIRYFIAKRLYIPHIKVCVTSVVVVVFVVVDDLVFAVLVCVCVCVCGGGF